MCVTFCSVLRLAIALVSQISLSHKFRGIIIILIIIIAIINVIIIIIIIIIIKP